MRSCSFARQWFNLRADCYSAMKVTSSILRDESQVGLGGLAGAPPPVSVDNASLSAAALGLVDTRFPEPLRQPVASVDNDSCRRLPRDL